MYKDVESFISYSSDVCYIVLCYTVVWFLLNVLKTRPKQVTRTSVKIWSYPKWGMLLVSDPNVILWDGIKLPRAVPERERLGGAKTFKFADDMYDVIIY